MITFIISYLVDPLLNILEFLLSLAGMQIESYGDLSILLMALSLAFVIAFCLFYGYRNDIEVATGASLATTILIFILFSVGFFSEAATSKRDFKRNEVLRVQQELNSFLVTASPELLSMLTHIKNEIKTIKHDIMELNTLLKGFPNRSDLIKKRVNLLKDIMKHLIDSCQKIEGDILTAYVTYKIDEIGGKKSFDKTRERLYNQAKESINYANELKESLKELSDH